ncbi:uncharacterized protein LOC130591979 [Beta vulgaris subsp. vulgaris]|uniref:uncharacterized protein LOC130591979 n=1 Tax=Beta vulgaris subsp. vulgaris TaxID=3555 RepID=UPI00254914AB|nr:uncharacterized protein LOC130591979 [Beta vulgaris subsp. vulgaris]XP_057251986.1 uncharacterized protein LOC130591979 [Beta vulgaris subsp. vulgaris]
MSNNNNNNSGFNIRPFLEKDRLNGENFLNWERTLRLVLRFEGREDVLDTPLPVITDESTDAEKRRAKQASDKSIPITCLMVAAMEPNLQKRFETKDAYTIMQELRAMFKTQARVERYETNREILECHLKPGQAVGPHVFEMMGLFENMERLGFPYRLELATDIILHSLPESFNQFRMTYNMNESEKTLQELHGLLVNAERNIPKVEPKKEVLLVQKGKGFKRNGQERRTKASKLPLSLKNLSQPPSPRLLRKASASTVTRLDTGRGTARYTWRK